MNDVLKIWIASAAIAGAVIVTLAGFVAISTINTVGAVIAQALIPSLG